MELNRSNLTSKNNFSNNQLPEQLEKVVSHMSQSENDDNNAELFEAKVDLKAFPNKKSTINFGDFCQIFNDCLNSKDLEDDLLASCFNSFDYGNSGTINSANIKKIFEVFNDKTSDEEIQSFPP